MEGGFGSPSCSCFYVKPWVGQIGVPVYICMWTFSLLPASPNAKAGVTWVGSLFSLPVLPPPLSVRQPGCRLQWRPQSRWTAAKVFAVRCPVAGPGPDISQQIENLEQEFSAIPPTPNRGSSGRVLLSCMGIRPSLPPHLVSPDKRGSPIKRRIFVHWVPSLRLQLPHNNYSPSMNGSKGSLI